MKNWYLKIAAIFVLSFAVAGCGINPLSSVANPVTNTDLYKAEIVFDGTVKTFNELKGLCANRVLPSACRTYVIKGQSLIVKAYAADAAAQKFVANNPTLDATNVVQAFTGLVSTFQTTVNNLSATKGS